MAVDWRSSSGTFIKTRAIRAQKVGRLGLNSPLRAHSSQLRGDVKRQWFSRQEAFCILRRFGDWNRQANVLDDLSFLYQRERTRLLHMYCSAQFGSGKQASILDDLIIHLSKERTTLHVLRRTWRLGQQSKCAGAVFAFLYQWNDSGLLHTAARRPEPATNVTGRSYHSFIAG